MQLFESVLGRKPANAGEGTSLLADWKSYSGQGDVESGTGPSTEGLFKNVDQAGATVSSFFKSAVDRVSTGVTSGVSTIQSTTENLRSVNIPSGQQLINFFGFTAGGIVLLVIAFTIFLPVIIIAPAKFALSFTLGCLCLMAGFFMLRGWKQQLQHMFSKERLPFSAGYLSSIVLTLYAALFMHSYLLSLLCSGLQMVALLYYVMSYFPGGTQGVKIALNLFYQAVANLFGGLTRMVTR